MPCLNSEGNLCPATWSSCQQQPAALSCSLPPVLLQLPELLSLFSSHLPRHSGPQLFDQVMVPFSQSHWQPAQKTSGGEIRFPFPFLFHPQGPLPCSFEGTVDIKAAWWLVRHTPPKSIYSHLPFISPSYRPLKKEEQVSSAANCWSCHCSFNPIVNYKSRSLGLSDHLDASGV